MQPKKYKTAIADINKLASPGKLSNESIKNIQRQCLDVEDAFILQQIDNKIEQTVNKFKIKPSECQ